MKKMNKRVMAIIVGAATAGSTAAFAGMGQCGAGKCGWNMMKKGGSSEMNQSIKGGCGAKMGEKAKKKVMKGKCGAQMKPDKIQPDTGK